MTWLPVIAENDFADNPMLGHRGDMLILYIIGIVMPVGITIHMIYVAFIKKRRAFGSLLVTGDEAVILRMHGASIGDRYNKKIELR